MLLFSSLGLDHLVGTPALKPYMHGYFLSLKLYDTARTIANPFAYAEHRERVVREKLEKMAETRIRAPKNMPANVKVNKGLADRIAKEEAREMARQERKKKRKQGPIGVEDMDADMDMEQPNLISDPRFKALFEDPEFEVDEGSREFALMNPSLVAKRQERNPEKAEQSSRKSRPKTTVEEEEEEDLDDNSSSEEDEDDDLDDDSGSDDDGRLYHTRFCSQLIYFQTWSVTRNMLQLPNR
jgi:ribosome biogenesis protein ENP2